MPEIHLLPVHPSKLAEAFAAIGVEMSGNQSIEMNISAVPHQISVSYQGSANAIYESDDYKAFVKDVEPIPAMPTHSGSLKAAHSNSKNNYHITYVVDPMGRSGVQGTFIKFDNAGDRSNAVRLVTIIIKHLNVSFLGPMLGEPGLDADRKAIQYKENAVADLTAQVSRLGGYLTEMAAKNTESMRTLTTELETQFNQKRKVLEDEAAATRMILHEERQQFEKEKAAYDDRNRTLVRRDIVSKMEANVEKRQKAGTFASLAATNSRWWISFFCLTLLIVSASAVVVSGWKVYDTLKASEMTMDWRLLPVFTFASLLFTCTLIFYLRWTTRWADLIAHQDLANQQYASDIYRASYIAELLFEYKDEQGKEIPSEVVEGMMVGLFERDEFKGGKYHPAEDAISFVKRLRKIKSGNEGVEIEVAPKSGKGKVKDE